MTSNIKLMSGKVLLSLVAVFTVAAPTLADWNDTHIHNPLWLPHAKFHDAQTMTMGILLGLAALYFIWRDNTSKVNLLMAIVLASLYWVSQAIAFLFPGVAWTDPNLLKTGQSLAGFPMQLKLDVALFFTISLSAWLMLSSVLKSEDRQGNTEQVHTNRGANVISR